MHEPDSRNTRLARLMELERRYDGPIPESAVRALSFPSERARKISDARHEMALFRRLLLEIWAAERRRCLGTERRSAAIAGSDLALYLAGWRERRRQIASLLLDHGDGR